ncbi:MAG TPA: DUF1844 domain-containing protein [Vicinamibacteria bacterium]|nr:DUF1844 domain-containing protein [Vicinamibacteria bacterium]
MSQSEKPFTVSDRRHFTPEGRPRDETEAAGPTEAPPAKAPPATPRPEEPADTSPPRAPGGPADFPQFLVGLAAQAGALLSGEGLPEGVDRAEALEGARSVIAIVEMLKDKTAGNLSGAESALLDDLLYQLRMAYVEKTRTGGA